MTRHKTIDKTGNRMYIPAGLSVRCQPEILELIEDRKKGGCNDRR